MDAFFFGDKCTPGGIDFPLVRILKNRCYQVTNGYKDTWEKLKTL
jgi:hypothetical protein